MISTKSDVSVMNAGTLVDGELLVADENLMSDKWINTGGAKAIKLNPVKKWVLEYPWNLEEI